MEAKTVFHRFEKKYMLSPWTYRRLLEQMAGEMEQDQFGLHTITSVYFDTDSYDIIRSSVQKPLFKEKLRLRWYGNPTPQDDVFLELKRKYHGLVYKRRIPISYDGAGQLLKADFIALQQGQIADEVDWFIRRYRPMPKLLLAYDREAFAGRHDPGLRITFDHNIRWRQGNWNLAEGSYGMPLLNREKVLMEIKAYHNLPIWLADLLAEDKIYPSSFSKYGTWYQQIHLKKGNYQHVG